MTRYIDTLNQIHNTRTTNANDLDLRDLPDWQALTGKVPGTTQVELMFDSTGTADILELCLRRSYPDDRPAAIVALRHFDEMRWQALRQGLRCGIRPTPIVKGFGGLHPGIRHAYVILTGDTPAETPFLVPKNIETLSILEMRLDQTCIYLPPRIKKAIAVTRKPELDDSGQSQWTLRDVITGHQEILTPEQMRQKAA